MSNKMVRMFSYHDRRLKPPAIQACFQRLSGSVPSAGLSNSASCRHLANDRGRERFICSQPGVGNVLRLIERVETKREQTKYGQIHRKGDTHRRTISIYTVTGHRVMPGYMPKRR